MKKLSVLAQSTTEYVIFLSLLIAVFTGIQIYLQRTVQGHIRLSSDILGEQQQWQQNDWRKGASEYMGTTESSSLVPEVQSKSVNLGGDVRIKKNQVVLNEGASNAKAMSEGF